MKWFHLLKATIRYRCVNILDVIIIALYICYLCTHTYKYNKGRILLQDFDEIKETTESVRARRDKAG